MYHSQKKSDEVISEEKKAENKALAKKIGESLDEFFLIKRGEMKVKCGLQYT
jgi:hypothetical protein